MLYLLILRNESILEPKRDILRYLHLRQYATSWKVAGSSPDEVIECFQIT
jgi:hypothetical protein